MWLLKSNTFCLANSAAERQMTSHHIDSTTCGASCLRGRQKRNRNMENCREGCAEDVDGLWQVGSTWGRDEEGLAGEEMEVWPRLLKEKSLVARHTF